MNTKRFDGFLVWVLVVVILAVAAVLLLATVKPAGAASVCGPLVGPAAVVETALTAANVPHTVRESVRSMVSCSGIGCPKPKPVCTGWIIRITATPTRMVELWFKSSGLFSGVR